MQTRMKLNGSKWGGIRENSGRPRRKSKGVSHSVREKVSSRTPLHINFRYSEHVRNKETLKILKKAIQNARKHGLIVLQYSFQSNHVHLIVEAANNKVLTKAMRSLTITFAKTLNRGRIQVERYHLHVLKTVREVKHAVHYVLFNQQKHEKGTCSTIDDYSSLLSLENALHLVRLSAKRKSKTIKIQKGGEWRPDEPESFLYKRGLTMMMRPA
jgi:REP element-mobilizing transposase RayT